MLQISADIAQVLLVMLMMYCRSTAGGHILGGSGGSGMDCSGAAKTDTASIFGMIWEKKACVSYFKVLSSLNFGWTSDEMPDLGLTELDLTDAYHAITFAQDSDLGRFCCRFDVHPSEGCYTLLPTAWSHFFPGQPGSINGLPR